MAAALNADVCEIYTDVDRVFTSDPRVGARCPQARREVSFDKMLELAGAGRGCSWRVP